MVTTAPRGSLGITGGAAGVVPWSTTSGSYTYSFPVAGLMMVACTKARVSGLVMVQPGPESWYGVASPLAVSGFAGTMMLQLEPASPVLPGGIGRGGG